MHPYLEQTRYATEVLINAIFHEENKLARLTMLLRDTERRSIGLEEGVSFLMMNPDLDDEGLGQLKALEHWETRNEVRRLSSDHTQLNQSIAAKQAATTALCGALIQIAKRGITGRNGKITVSKSGRKIDGLPLEEIIWEARNQSMHYEEPLRKAAYGVFTALSGAHPGQFDFSAKRDLAREVIDLLGWKDLSIYTADMESILP